MLKKKAYIVCLAMFYVSMIIAILMQLGNLINKTEADSISQEVKEISALASDTAEDLLTADTDITLGSIEGADTNQMYTFVRDSEYYGNTYCGGHHTELTLTEGLEVGKGARIPDEGR